MPPAYGLSVFPPWALSALNSYDSWHPPSLRALSVPLPMGTQCPLAEGLLVPPPTKRLLVPPSPLLGSTALLQGCVSTQQAFAHIVCC